MSYPTSEQLDAWADTLTKAKWAELVARVATAIDRDRRGGSAIPDGYPGGGGSAGGHSGFVLDGEFVPATSVELVAISREQAHDEHHDRTINAIGFLEQALMSLGALATQLDRIEARSVILIDTSAEDWCANHLRHGYTEPRYRGDLCQPCYRFQLVERVMPPKSLLDDRARGVAWTNASIRRALGRPA